MNFGRLWALRTLLHFQVNFVPSMIYGDCSLVDGRKMLSSASKWEIPCKLRDLRQK